MENRIHHPFEALYDANSTILILGSFPSVVSREKSFYYMHPQNRFYKILSTLYKEPFYEASIEEKKKLLHIHHIAIYDSILECKIEGSKDSSIQGAIPTNIEEILQNSSIKRIFCNGKKSYEIFCKYHPEYVSIAYMLPSSSPLNASYSLEKLIESWRIIL